MNAAMRRAIQESDPDVVLVWRGTHVLAQTLAMGRSARRVLICYNNDDPFSPAYSTGPLHHRRMWRLFRRRIPDYDIHLVYRPINVGEVRAAGAREVHVFPPYFVPEMDERVALTPEDRQAYGCDIVFIGHYEPDGRFEALKALVDAGVRVRLFGTNWPARTLERLRIGKGPVQPVRGVEYRKALCAASMALCFLSRLNRDVYTRRIFEITACGTLLVSERTSELERWFADGSEAVFFSSPTELVSRVHALLAMPEMVDDIAAAGCARVHADGHSVDGRMEQLLSIVETKFATPGKVHAVPG